MGASSFHAQTCQAPISTTELVHWRANHHELTYPQAVRLSTSLPMSSSRRRTSIRTLGYTSLFPLGFVASATTGAFATVARPTTVTCQEVFHRLDSAGLLLAGSLPSRCRRFSMSRRSFFRGRLRLRSRSWFRRCALRLKLMKFQVER
jgi:hypothetical protein